MERSFHATICSLAWIKTMKAVAGESAAETISRIAAAALSLVFAYLWVAQIDRNSSAFTDAQLAALLALGVLVSLFFGGLLINLLCLVPATVWRERGDRLMAAEIKLTPKFLVSFEGAIRPLSVAYGQTSTSWGGTQQTVILEQNLVFRLDARNETEANMVGCEAYLARFKSSGEMDDPSWQSLQIPWLPIDAKATEITIPPKGLRSFTPFRVINNRVIFLTTALPVTMIHAIKDKGEYEGLIVLTALGTAPTYIRFSLLCDGPENAPIMSILKQAEIPV